MSKILLICIVVTPLEIHALTILPFISDFHSEEMN